jgi:DNA-binding FadR family transcriptional regulator
MNLAPVETPSLTDAVERRVLEGIRANSLKPGDALPGEQALASQLGISRSMVREALSRLRMLGLLTSRKRRGMVLAHADLFEGLERVMDPAFLDQETVRDLLEMRLVLEMGLADLLFERKTPEDIRELEQIVAQERKAPTRAERLAAEIAFHAKLYRMAGNRTLARFQALLRPFFQSLAADQPRRGAVQHPDLIEILRSGDPDDFRRAMRRHLTPHFDRILQRDRGAVERAP